MEMDEKQKMIIAAAVGVLLVGVLLYLTYSAKTQKEAAEKDIAAFQKRFREARERIKEIPALRQKEFELNNAVNEYVKILPTEQEVEKMYDTVNDLKDEAGIQLSSYRPGKQAGKSRQKMSSNFQMHTRDIRISGNFFAIVKFINLIERYKRFMRVESFDLKPTEGDILDSTVKFSTFTYTPKKASKSKKSAKSR